MKILLDTHVVLALLRNKLRETFPLIEQELNRPENEGLVSVASFWEIAIKSRLGKLDPRMPLELIEAYVEAYGFAILPISTAHVISRVEPEPPVRDPFDRLLLAQCAVEGLRLATVDHTLREHPLALQLQ